MRREELLWNRALTEAREKEIKNKKEERSSKMETKVKNIVVINETHSLMEEQVSLLDERFGEGNWDRLDLPAGGLKLEEIKSLVCGLPDDCEIVIASPVPALMMVLSQVKAKWSVFHNDNRDKKELPNGKIIMVVSKTGWVIF